ncbi:RHS repeat-associated core domain-containing protein, partial [Victivallis sp.]|uniref:RHS repeat-associated core domain-containing protein n=1 Tax=Victivallis sp. TaxID=2049020 RepID=UPI003A8E7698
PVDGDENPFRFSSEYADDETGLVYYNYRYYSPQLGRWTKRDPIEEEGGGNIYCMTNNNAINNFDFFGLAGSDTHNIPKCQKTDSCKLGFSIGFGTCVEEFSKCTMRCPPGF